MKVLQEKFTHLSDVYWALTLYQVLCWVIAVMVQTWLVVMQAMVKERRQAGNSTGVLCWVAAQASTGTNGVLN